MRRRVSIYLICVVSLCLCLSGCVSKQSPGDQVGLILEQIRTNEIEADVAKLFNDKDLAKEYGDEYEQLITKIQDFDYKVTDEEYNDDKTEAKVTVRISTYDYVDAYKKTKEQVVSQAKKQKLDRDSNVADYVSKTLFKNMLELKGKSAVTEVTIDCTLNEDGDWTPDVEESKELVNAILGGLIDEAKLKVKIKK